MIFTSKLQSSRPHPHPALFGAYTLLHISSCALAFIPALMIEEQQTFFQKPVNIGWSYDLHNFHILLGFIRFVFASTFPRFSIVSNPTGRKMMRFLYHVSCFVVKSTATFWASWLWHSKENTINTYFHFNLWETSVLFGDPVWASSCESPHSWFYFPEDLTKFSPRIFPHRHFVVTFTHTGIVSKLRASSFSFLIYKYWFVTSIASTYRPPL